MGFEKCHPAVNFIYFTTVIAGMIVFHHKTRKWKFRILVPVSVVLWAGILCSVLIK